MNRRSILTKTGKGLMEATGKTSNLSRDLRNILKEIDGKVSVSELLDKFEKMTEPKLLDALSGMERDGYVREFVAKQDESTPRTPARGGPASQSSVGDASDLDFTAFTPAKKANEEARLQAQAQEIARQAQATRAREEVAAKAKAEQAARARAQAEQKAKPPAAPSVPPPASPAPYAGILGAGADAQARAQQDALDRARREAERKDAEERARREAEARAKAEIEAAVKREAEERARRELQEKIRREDEERARREAEARAKQEAEARAKREAEERLRREMEERAKREIEERLRREEAERRLREEAERKQRVEAEARARVEAELRAKREAEERARRAEEARIRKKADDEERARREAEQAEALERTLRDEQEKARREEAERVHREDEERVQGEEQERTEREEPIFEEEVAERLEKEDTQAREEEERQAREEERRARREAKEAERAAAKARKAERARERAGEEAWRGDEDALRDSAEASLSAAEVWERRRPRSLIKTLAIMLVVLAVVGVAVLPFVPLETARYEKAAQAWLDQPVKIGSVTLSLLPLPQLKLEKVAIGRDTQMKIAVVRASPEIASLLEDRISLKSLALENVTLPKEFLAALVSEKGARRALGVERISAKGLRLEGPDLGLPPLDLDASLAPDGTLKSASLSNAERQLSLTLEPRGGRAAVEISSRELPLPIGVDIGLSDFQAKGTVTRSELILSSIEVRAFGGRLLGSARLRWGSGWSLDGELSARQMDAAKIASPLLGTGTLQGKGGFSMRGLLPERMVLNSQIEGNFTVQKGTINNVDMTRLLQGSGSGGGTTPFQELSGVFSADPNRLVVRQIRMAAGLLSGAGQLDMDSQKNLSGRMQIELRAQSVQARTTIGVTGTLANPQFRRSN